MNPVLCSVLFFLIEMYNVGRTNTLNKTLRIPLSRIDPRVGKPGGAVYADWSNIWEDSHNVHVVNVSIGSIPPQYFNMVFDTQLHRPWVYSILYRLCDVNSFLMQDHRPYNHDASSTYETPDDDEPVPGINKGDRPGWQLGFKATDLISMGGVHLSYEFLEVVKASAHKPKTKHDGSIGLRFDGKNPNFLMKVCNKIKGEHKASFYLSRNNLNKTGAESQYGEFMLCGEDETKYIPGTMRYHSDIKPGYWIFRVDKIEVDWGYEILRISSGNINVTIDTSTEYIYAPELNITAMYRFMKAKPLIHKPGSQQVICEIIPLMPLLKFQVSGITYELAGGDYTRQLFNPITGVKACELLIRNHTLPHWALGEIFIRKYYTVFDMKNNKIGLATAKDS